MAEERMRFINQIIIHCTATKPTADIGAAEIRKYHTEHNHWRDIGYHYVIRRNGKVERGRYISQPGAHCKGHNAHSIGIAYVGGLDENGQPADTRTPEQRAALKKLIWKLVAMTGAGVYGHRDFANKDCPCFDAKAEYKELANKARNLRKIN